MVGLDALVFGYRHAKVSPEDTGRLINVLLRLGIAAEVSHDGRFILKERDVKSFRAYASGRLRYEMGEIMGLPGVLGQFMAHRGAVSALIITLLMHILLSLVVWDIRVEGNERLSDEDVVSALEDNGFSVGALWGKFDKNLVETSVLLSNPDISWISVNRRGTVAYVRISESENLGRAEENPPEYSNIIADRDAVIEDITVESGVAAVKKGDVVRKGDVLISGIVETESGTRLCRAKGSVIGQSVTDLTAEIGEKGMEREITGEKIYQIRLKIFKFSINIFKNYRICLNEYDIIEDEIEYSFLDRCKLPFSFEVTRRREYTDEEVCYTESEMTEMARALMDDMIREAMDGCEVAKLRSDGVFRDGVYVLTTKIIYFTDIAYEREFEVS